MKKNLISKAGRKKALRILMTVLVVILLIMMVSLPALAVEAEKEEESGLKPGMDSLVQIVVWIADWTAIIGLVVAFFGGLQTAFGFMNDDADAKVSGLKVLAAGFMVYGISASLDLFFPWLSQ